MTHVNVSQIKGASLSLRPVVPNDAAYIYELRRDPTYNMHLSVVTGTVEDQRSWIEAYKEREAEGLEYYFVSERIDGVRCGLVRLYNITKDRFTWGSWILDDNKPPKAALESAVLSFGIAFERLGLATGDIDVRKDNLRAIAFYRRFGMQETRTDDQNIYFEYSSDQFARDLPANMAVLNALERI